MGKTDMKPAIRFKGFTEPWEQRKLGDLVNYQSSPLTAKDATDNGNYILYDANQAIGTTNKLNIEQDYITIIKDGAGVGRIRILPKNTAFIGTMGALIPNKNDLEFIFALLTNSDLNKKFSGSTIPHIYFKDYGKELYLVPVLSEQHLVGRLFKQIDYLITLHQRKSDALINIKKALLDKMFPSNGADVPEIRFKGFAEPWEQRKLAEIGKTFTGLSGKNADDFGHGDGFFLPYLNIFNNPLADLSNLENIEIDNTQNTIKYGDIFFTTSSETPEEVGMTSVWLGNKSNIYLNSFCFGYRLNTIYDPYYFAYMLRSNTFRNKIMILAQGISRFNISKNKVMDLNVLIPKLDEQRNLGNVLYKLDNLITLHQRKCEKLKNIKKALLEKMFV